MNPNWAIEFDPSDGEWPERVIHLSRDDEDQPDGRVISYIKPASAGSISKVILEANPADQENGRSEFFWVRLFNGDLMLATYPEATRTSP